MENAQLISLSRQVALQRQMDVMANNMANLNTTGFKAEDLMYQEYKMPVARDRDFAYNDQILSYTEDWGTLRNLDAGPIQDTGNPLDMALQGDGYFAIQAPDGTEQYTKAGAFQIDNTGTLVDLSGNPVLTEVGPVTFTTADTDIQVDSTGNISTSQGNKGKLKVVEFANPQALEHAGSNLFTGTGGTPAIETRVLQGSIEKSNVSGVTEMANMVRVTRAYESLSTLMQQQSDMRQTAIKRLGDMTA